MAKFGDDATREAAEHFGITPPDKTAGGFAMPAGFRDIDAKSLQVSAAHAPDGTPAVLLEVLDSTGHVVMAIGLAPEQAMGSATSMTQAAGTLLGPEKFEAASKRILERLERELKRTKYGDGGS